MTYEQFSKKRDELMVKVVHARTVSERQYNERVLMMFIDMYESNGTPHMMTDISDIEKEIKDRTF